MKQKKEKLQEKSNHLPKIKLGNRIKKIMNTDLDGFKVGLVFEDGTKGTVSLAHIFNKPKFMMAEVLRGGAFDKCFIDSGALAWPNGFELCPDAIRHWMKMQKKGLFNGPYF